MNKLCGSSVDDPDSIQPEIAPPSHKHLTWRAIFVGVIVGSLLCFSNMYFGLQTGWVTMGSLQSSLLGFGVFKVLFRSTTFSPVENVLLQTAAVATATMPLAGGFVGIIPALKMMTEADGGPISLNWWQLFVFSFGLAFFGVFFAVPLRTQTILREKLKFPSGAATAEMIKVLHRVNRPSETEGEESDNAYRFLQSDDGQAQFPEFINQRDEDTDNDNDFYNQLKVLGVSFGLSGIYMILSYFIPVLKNLPVMTWFGVPVATEFYWMLTPSFSYIGQGMIMGTHTCLSMMVGAAIGWGVLAPIARGVGWAPGVVSDFENGAQGWLLWISLAVMMSESVSSLVVLAVQWVIQRIQLRKETAEDEIDPGTFLPSYLAHKPASSSQQVPTWWWVLGLTIASAICVACSWGVFFERMPFYQPIIGVLFSLIISVLAVRALGQTDMNPVSGIGKLSQVLSWQPHRSYLQVVFAFIARGNIAANLVAGAIAEAGAQQAGDMMQDLKTGHLLKASPKAQFIGQVIGSFFSVFVATGAFLLYSNSYKIPGPEFQVPTAPVWLNMARFVNDGKLPPNVVWFCIPFAIVAAIIPIITAIYPRSHNYVISGMAFGISLYVTPNWTIPRFFGALLQWFWKTWWPQSHDKYMLVLASGFVLGEGVCSIITALLKNPGGVQPWTCAGCVPGFCSC